MTRTAYTSCNSLESKFPVSLENVLGGFGGLITQLMSGIMNAYDSMVSLGFVF